MLDADAAICHHLLPFLGRLKSQGSKVLSVNDDAWSNCLLNVVLDSGPSLSRACETFETTAGIKLWHNDDTHYDIENGLFCEHCKHSISWPRPEAER